MKIIITGATGFVGAALVKHFAALGHEVIALGRSSSPPSSLLDLATYIQADISKSVPNLKGDVVIHSAALATDQATYSQHFQTNYLGTKRVFNSIRCKKFVHISTSSVYNFSNTLHSEMEITNFEQLSDYGKTKRLAEEFLQKEKQQGVSIFILRPRAIYGIGDRVLLPRILNLVRGKKIRLPGNLRVSCSMTHIENLILAIEKCIVSDFNFRMYNVADAKVYQLREVVETLVSAVFEQKIPIQILNLSMLNFIASLLTLFNIQTKLTPMAIATISKPNVLNIEKIQTELDYRPERNFYNSYSEIVAWVKTVGLEKVKNAEKDLPWSE